MLGWASLLRSRSRQHARAVSSGSQLLGYEQYIRLILVERRGNNFPKGRSMKSGKSRRRSGATKLILLGLTIGSALGVGIVGWRDAEPLQQQVKSLASSDSPQAAAPLEAPEGTKQEPAAAQTDHSAQSFSFCHTGGGINCVVDGDTFWMEGSKIRLADIDAPETHPSHCQKEADLGTRATKRLQQLLNSGSVELLAVDRDTDRYGRKLRIAMVDGKSVGQVLFEEQLVRQWKGRREPWC